MARETKSVIRKPKVNKRPAVWADLLCSKTLNLPPDKKLEESQDTWPTIHEFLRHFDGYGKTAKLAGLKQIIERLVEMHDMEIEKAAGGYPPAVAGPRKIIE
jgi:hypothetical protein